MRASLAVVVVLLGCAAPQPAAPPRPAGEPFICRYSLNPWYLGAAELRLAPTERPFAKTKPSPKAGVELTLPYGPATQGARLTFTSGWVTMRVNYQPKDGLPLSVQAPVPLSEVATLGRGGRVRWVGSAGERLVVRLTRPQGLEGPRHVETTLACEDTSIAWLKLSFPGDAASTPDAGAERWLDVPKGVAVPVSLVPGGPAAETLRFEEDDRLVRVMGEAGDAVRVRVGFGDVRVEGYVPRKALVERDTANVFGAGGLLGGLMGREGGGQRQHARCAAEVPLLLRLDGVTRPLGTLRKNAAWREVGRVGGEVEVALPELDWVALEPGAAFVVSAASAAACAGEGAAAGE